MSSCQVLKPFILLCLEFTCRRHRSSVYLRILCTRLSDLGEYASRLFLSLEYER